MEQRIWNRRGTAFRRGFSIFELLIVFAVGIIFAMLLFVGLSSFRNRSEFNATTKQVVALLREARSRAAAGTSNAAWGVYFDNGTSTAPYYALFSGTYSSSTRIGYYALPESISYVTSSLGRGATSAVTFSPITGFASTSTSISITRKSGDVSSTISVGASGAVSY